MTGSITGCAWSMATSSIPTFPQTQGMSRAAAINFARVGAEKIWAGHGAHPCERQDRRAPPRAGRERDLRGEGQGAHALGREAGIHRRGGPRAISSGCRPSCRTRRSMRARAKTLECVLLRSGQQPVVVNLDIPVVEKPEEVLLGGQHPPPSRKGLLGLARLPAGSRRGAVVEPVGQHVEDAPDDRHLPRDHGVALALRRSRARSGARHRPRE